MSGVSCLLQQVRSCDSECKEACRVRYAHEYHGVATPRAHSTHYPATAVRTLWFWSDRDIARPLTGDGAGQANNRDWKGTVRR